MREVIFDTETTGLSFDEGHRLVEIGCIEIVNKVETGRTFHVYLNPQRSMPPEAERIHGLSNAFLSDKPLFADTVDAFLEFIGDDPMVAHNANFDFGFINGELTQSGRAPLSYDRMVDTLAIAKVRHPGSKHTLDALCTRYGIDRTMRTLHGALLDAQLLAQVYIELSGGRQIGLDLAKEVEDNVIPIHSPGPRPSHAPRLFEVSADERERHSAFITSLQDPLWNKS